MTDLPLCQGSFTLTRTWKASPARVFAAWADPAVKAQWFRGPSGWKEVRREIDVRVGGREIAEGQFAESGVTTLFDARYHVVEPDRRLIYVYDLYLSGALHSVTLASLDLEPDGDETHVSYAEQIVFMDGEDGVDMRRGGTEWHFENIQKLVTKSA